MPPSDENAAKFLVLAAQAVTGTIPVGGKDVGVVALDCRVSNLEFIEDGDQHIYLVFGAEDIRALTKDLKEAATKVLPLSWQVPTKQEETPAQ